MNDRCRSEFLDGEARLRSLVVEAGFTEPDLVLPDFDPRNFVLQWTEPDLVEFAVNGRELAATGVLPGALAQAAAGIGAAMRTFIDERDLPTPDIVRPGRNRGDVEFVWRAEKLIVIVSEDEGIVFPQLN